MWILFSCCDDFVLTVSMKHFTVYQLGEAIGRLCDLRNPDRKTESLWAEMKG